MRILNATSLNLEVLTHYDTIGIENNELSIYCDVYIL